jgi:PAS domain S-box-containing protein
MSARPTMTMERLIAMTRQATRAATTVERLLDSVSSALIIATDANGRITHVNTGAQETLGYTPEEVLGRGPAMFYTIAELERQAAYYGGSPDHQVITLEMVRLDERRRRGDRLVSNVSHELRTPITASPGTPSCWRTSAWAPSATARSTP